MSEKPLPLTNDLAFKKLLEDEESLKSLLQNFLPISKGSEVVEAIQDSGEKIPSTVAEPQGKVFILDLKVTIRRMEEGRLLEPEIVTVEIQTTHEKFFIRRLMAYTARVYSEQLDRGDNYKELRPVYCMAFCTVNLDVFRKRDKYYHPSGFLTFDPPHQVVDDCIQVVFIELEKFAKSAKELVDRKEAWCYLLRNSHEMEDWEFDLIKSKGEDMKQAVERLQKLSADGYTRAEIEAYEKQRKIHFTEKEVAREEAREERDREIALNMLVEGIDIAIISKSTGLTPEQVKALKKQS